MNQKICVDARMWGTKHTGIGRYVENLIANFPKDIQSKVVLIVPPDLINEPKLSLYPKFVAKYHPYSLLSQFEMLYLLLKIRPALLHVPHFTVPVFWPGKFIVTIHDLIKHHSTGSTTTTHSPWAYKVKLLGYKFIVKYAVSRAFHVIVPSKFWQMELVSRYSLPISKITVTHEGVDKTIFAQPINDAFSPPFKTHYVIYAGNVYPHKNIPVLLQAVKNLAGNINLVLVCSRSVFLDRLNQMVDQMGISSYVKIFSHVSDAELVNLYQYSLAFVFPSLIEGFGLPGLEAMLAGTPVIAARASCLPEIYGDAAEYFNPTDSQELAKKIQFLGKNVKFRFQLIEKGKLQASKYSWSTMAKLTCQIYQSALQ